MDVADGVITQAQSWLFSFSCGNKRIECIKLEAEHLYYDPRERLITKNDHKTSNFRWDNKQSPCRISSLCYINSSFSLELKI